MAVNLAVLSTSLFLLCCLADQTGSPDDGTCFYQRRAVTSQSGAVFAGCATPAPKIDGIDVESLISQNQGVLIVGIPNMRCAQAATAALKAKGVSFEMKEFEGSFEYKPGTSEVWDWLHCTYPDDAQGDTVMHSYVFLGSRFLGQGFAAATKIQSGELDSDLGVHSGGGSAHCDEQFPADAKVIKQFMDNSSNRVLLFGWLDCPCTGVAMSRFDDANLCYAGRQWANPESTLMAYLQCRDGTPDDHSFVYFRSGDIWEFAGNGFGYSEKDMPVEELQAKVAGAQAQTNCTKPSIKKNVYGRPLEECRVGNDVQGSWLDDGTCSEQIGGVHQVCIESLPADFSTETHQPAWSKERAGKRHCVCIGAWSLYMTDAANHTKGAEEIMPHCLSIPETALSARYLTNWKDWNGYPASIVNGVSELVRRCLEQASDTQLKCGLKKKFDRLEGDATELKEASQLDDLRTTFNNLSCPQEML